MLGLQDFGLTGFWAYRILGLQAYRLTGFWPYRQCFQFVRHCFRFFQYCFRFFGHCFRFVKHCFRFVRCCLQFVRQVSMLGLQDFGLTGYWAYRLTASQEFDLTGNVSDL